MKPYIDIREVTLMQKLNSNSFMERNAKIFTVTDKPINANDAAQKKLLSNSSFLNSIMPILVSVDSKDRNWRKIVSKYFYEITINVSLITGKKLNNSLTYDVNAIGLKDNIKSLGVAFKSNEELADYVNKNIEEVNKHMYSIPVNYIDYFAYVFSYYHSRVANSIDLIKKTTRIEFYMVTEEAIAKKKQLAYNTGKTIRKYLAMLDDKPALFEHVCNIQNIKGNSYIDKFANVEVFAQSNPNGFIKLINDKDLASKSLVHSYIKGGLLFKIPNNSLIVDMNDRSVIIGANMNEAISFFANPSNKDYVDTLKSQYSTIDRQTKIEN